MPERSTTAATQNRVTAGVALLRPFALLGIAFGALITVADPDLWGHVRFGLDILQSGNIVTPVDPYSFTQDRPWVNHEWLSEVITAAPYKVGGTTALFTLKGLLTAILAGSAWLMLRRTSFVWRWSSLALLAWGTLPLTFTLRPQFWTAILLVPLITILTSESRRLYWLLPALFALWANLHGGWIVGGGLFAIFAGAALIERRPTRWALLGTGLVSFLATLLTPYGLDLWTFLLETIRLDRSDISEWRPIWQQTYGYVVIWALTLVTALITLRKFGWPPLATTVSLACLAVASARVGRLLPLFVIAAVTLLSKQWPPEEEAGAGQVARSLLDVVGVTAVILIAFRVGAILPCPANGSIVAPDTVAAEALRGTRGRLIPHFPWGEYALWHFGPALQVSFDGRRETVYSTQTIREQWAIRDGTDLGFETLRRLNPDYVWLPVESAATVDWLTTNGYREDIRTERSFIAVRRDLPPLRAWEGTPSGCFPGP